MIYFANNNGLNSSSTSNVSNTTITTIIDDDGSWSNAIRTLFIYGTGGYRLSLLKGGELDRLL